MEFILGSVADNGEFSQTERCHPIRACRETTHHFFLHCALVGNLWSNFVGWIGDNWAAPVEMNSHNLGFASLLRRGKFEKQLGGIWICVIWILCKWRILVLFEGKE